MSTPAEQMPANPAAPVPAAPAASPAPSAPAAAPVDRRAALSAAFDKKEAPAPVKAVESAPPPPAAPKADASPAEPARGPDGKFVSAKPAEAAAAPVETPPSVPAKQWKLPSSWKRDVEPVYSKLAANPEFEPLLSEIERREADYHNGIAQYRDAAQFAKSMQDALNPYMATIQSLGVPPHTAVQHLMAADHMLRYGGPGEKARALQKIASEYNINIGELQQTAAANPPPPPELMALRGELQTLKQQQQRAQTEAVVREIQAFAEGKEHFSAVEEDMAKLITSGVAADLDTAYDMACWARPDVREQLVAKQREQAQAQARETEHKAQAAAVSVAGAPIAAASGAPSPKDRRALIASLIDK